MIISLSPHARLRLQQRYGLNPTPERNYDVGCFVGDLDRAAELLGWASPGLSLGSRE